MSDRPKETNRISETRYLARKRITLGDGTQALATGCGPTRAEATKAMREHARRLITIAHANRGP